MFAASSLKDSFTTIGTQFEAAHPGVKVTFNFAGSGDLATQIGQGAPADVFASADESTMAKAVGNSGAVAQRFASNQLAIIVAANNPKKIAGLADLARSDVALVIGAPEVPIGKYSAKALTKAGVTVAPKSLEQNVKAIVAKVTLGEADAGIVYVTLGGVFTSSSRFLNEPASKKASDLIQQHGGNAGSSLAQAGAAVQGLSDGLDGAHTGARKLTRGSKSVTSGAKELHRGLSKLAKGAGKVSSGSRSASAGASKLSSGLVSASQGASSLSSGLQKVSGATGTFSGGLSQLSSGGSQLSSGAEKVALRGRDRIRAAAGCARLAVSSQAAAPRWGFLFPRSLRPPRAAARCHA